MAKREKHVFTTQMVSHVWAQQTQESGRNPGSSTSFDGTALYSYATPIANFVTNKKGKSAVLITTQRYSVTTSGKHMPGRNDIPPGTPVFHVKHIGITGGRAPQPKTENFHKDNLQNFIKSYKYSLQRFATQRRGNEDFTYDTSEIKAYCKFFGLRFPAAQFKPVPKEQLDVMLKKARKESAKKAVETKKIKEEERKECEKALLDYMAGNVNADLGWNWDKHASSEQKTRLFTFRFERYKAGGELDNKYIEYATPEQLHELAEVELKNYLADEGADSLSWHWTHRASVEQVRRYETVMQKREVIKTGKMRAAIDNYLQNNIGAALPDSWQSYATEEQEAAINAGYIERWRSGEDSRLKCYMNSTLLRIRGENIETSRGAQFPIAHGVRAWAVVRACKERGETWQRNGHTVHLGHFQIDRVESNGTVKAGCHTVDFAEVELIAKQLNLI